MNSVKIGAFGPFFNSGSIIISDYHNEVLLIGVEHHWFTISTLETPFDSEHPVAGNRMFGIYNTAENPTKWTFYTMGVDRTWDWFDGLGNTGNYGFQKADELWQSVQQNIVSRINSGNELIKGEATFYSKRYHTSRPYWDEVKRFLKKQINFDQLKRELGC